MAISLSTVKDSADVKMPLEEAEEASQWKVSKLRPIEKQTLKGDI